MAVGLLWVLCCQVEISVMGQSLIQSNATECVCVSLSVIKCNNNLYTYNEYIERGQDYKQRKKNYKDPI
jgi:hypothetical protein